MTFNNRIKSIRRTLTVLIREGSIAELRVPNSDQGALSGLFDDLDELARTAADPRLGPGLYVTMHHIGKSLRPKVKNQVFKASTAVRDQDIDWLCWLLLDFDPVRASNTSTTDEEHEAAIAITKKCQAYLIKLGWPEPVLADSGNGCHLLFRIDLRNDQENCALLKKNLEVLSLRFTNAAVRLDTANFNASRLTRLYGTKNRKGQELDGRKHRWSALLKVPEKIEIVSAEQLIDLASRLPTAASAQKTGPKFDVPEWLERFNVPVAFDLEWNENGHKWILPQCPFDATHQNRSAYIVQFADGNVAAGCLHTACAGNDWPKLRAIYEPRPEIGDIVPKLRDIYETQIQIGDIVPKIGSETSNNGATQTADLIELASRGARLFRTASGESYAAVSVRNHVETHRVNSNLFRHWLTYSYYRQTQNTPRPQALQQAIAHMESVAQFDSPTQTVFVRVAAAGELNYLQLADEQRRVVEFDKEGWRVVEKSAVGFRQVPGMLPLPVPIQGGELSDLREFLNLSSDEDWILFATDLIAALFVKGPFPILGIHGEAGSAKTTAERIFRNMVDPNVSPCRAMPKNVHDLMIAANNSWLLSFDNLSYLPIWFSDSLCRLSTGGGFSTRKLYADSTEVLFEGCRPSVLTGIEELATRTDLLDRSIVLELPVIRKYTAEQEFWRKFETAHPQLLGALLDVAVSVLQELPKIELAEQPRMADFARLGMAAEPALDVPRGAFMQAYQRNRRRANAVALEASPIANLICDLPEPSWEGTATMLLGKLDSMVVDDVRKHRSWPKTPKTLSGMVRRLSTALRTAGVEIRFDRDNTLKRSRIISIQRLKAKTKAQ